jgi:geranyl-CoA carboxylase alpha subunit
VTVGAKATPFSRLLVANRGEIAVRIMKSARAAGLATVAVHSEADASSPHVAIADEAVLIGPSAPRDSYLRIDRIIEAARTSGADAVHPGYGFLAENAELAEACAQAGLVFVGPSAAAIRAMGNKAGAKALMEEAGVPCVPGYRGTDRDPELLERHAAEVGYPVMIKAVAGGGGRGMRLVRHPDDFGAALASARSEAKVAFGDDAVLLERAIVDPRHIEIQVLADRHGNAVHLGERDCSVQRRHQKLIEEAPSPAVSEELRARMGEAALKAVRAIGYEGAGTLEFLLSADGSFYFMEMNTRLQVEHPVTEAITGLDLVALQLDIAAGRPLPFVQDEVRFDGHAIEVRLCAEDPAHDFLPQSGRIALWEPAGHLRVEHALHSGAEVPPFYDSMIAKLIAHGPDRDAARQRLIRGLEETMALGVRTNQGFLLDCLAHPTFVAGEATTGFIERHRAELLADRPKEEAAVAAELSAMLRAGPDIGVTHAFPAPVRLRRDDRVHDLRVVAGPRGRCRVERAGDVTECRVTRIDGDRIAFEAAGRIRGARLVRAGHSLWCHVDGRSWDFEDASFDPVMRAEAASDGRVRASMNGRVALIDVAVGDRVTRGQRVLVLEAMKMEHAHLAAIDGTVEAVHVAEGEQVDAHRVVVEVVAP